MPRRTPIRELQEEEPATPSSPLRRSSRIINSPVPKGVISRRNSASEAQTTTPKVTRRRSSVTNEAEIEPQASQTATRSKRVSAVNGAASSEETPSKRKTRASSVTKEPPIRRTSTEDDSSRTTRSRNTSLSKKVEEEETDKKTTRSRRKSVERLALGEPGSTPIKKTPSPKESNEKILDSIEEANGECDESTEPEEGKGVQKRKANLNLSIIAETCDEDEGSPNKKQKKEVRLSKGKEEVAKLVPLVKIVKNESVERRISKSPAAENRAANVVNESFSDTSFDLQLSSSILESDTSSLQNKENMSPKDNSIEPMEVDEAISPVKKSKPDEEKIVEDEVKDLKNETDKTSKDPSNPGISNKLEEVRRDNDEIATFLMEKVNSIEDAKNKKEAKEIANVDEDSVLDVVTLEEEKGNKEPMERTNTLSGQTNDLVKNSEEKIAEDEVEESSEAVQEEEKLDGAKKAETLDASNASIKEPSLENVSDENKKIEANKVSVSEQNQDLEGASHKIEASLAKITTKGSDVLQSPVNDGSSKGNQDTTATKHKSYRDTKQAEEMEATDDEAAEKDEEHPHTTNEIAVSQSLVKDDESGKARKQAEEMEASTSETARKDEECPHTSNGIRRSQSPNKNNEDGKQGNKIEALVIETPAKGEEQPHTAKDISVSQGPSKNNEDGIQENEIEALAVEIPAKGEEQPDTARDISVSQGPSKNNEDGKNEIEALVVETPAKGEEQPHTAKDISVSQSPSKNNEDGKHENEIQALAEGEEQPYTAKDISVSQSSAIEEPAMTNQNGTYVKETEAPVVETAAKGKAEETTLNEVVESGMEDEPLEIPKSDASKEVGINSESKAEASIETTDMEKSFQDIVQSKDFFDDSEKVEGSVDDSIIDDDLGEDTDAINDKVFSSEESEDLVLEISDNETTTLKNNENSVVRRSLDNKTSIKMQDFIKAGDDKQRRLSGRLQKVVEVFCAGIKNEGDVSINVSLEYGGCEDEQKKGDVLEVSMTAKVDKKPERNEAVEFRGSKRRKLDYSFAEDEQNGDEELEHEGSSEEVDESEDGEKDEVEEPVFKEIEEVQISSEEEEEESNDEEDDAMKINEKDDQEEESSATDEDKEDVEHDSEEESTKQLSLSEGTDDSSDAVVEEEMNTSPLKSCKQKLKNNNELIHQSPSKSPNQKQKEIKKRSIEATEIEDEDEGLIIKSRKKRFSQDMNSSLNELLSASQFSDDNDDTWRESFADSDSSKSVLSTDDPCSDDDVLAEIVSAKIEVKQPRVRREIKEGPEKLSKKQKRKVALQRQISFEIDEGVVDLVPQISELQKGKSSKKRKFTPHELSVIERPNSKKKRKTVDENEAAERVQMKPSMKLRKPTKKFGRLQPSRVKCDGWQVTVLHP